MALLSNLLPSVTTLSDTGILHYLCVCVCMWVFSVHTSVPAHATVLTADPCRNASQHILTAIPAYAFRSRGSGFTLNRSPVNHRADTHGQTTIPTGTLEPPISLTRLSLDCGRKPEHLEQPLAGLNTFRREVTMPTSEKPLRSYSVIE